MSAHDVLRQLHALGARIECQDGRLKLLAGKRTVPERLVEQARPARSELISLLDNPNCKNRHLSQHAEKLALFVRRPPSKPQKTWCFAEERQVASFVASFGQIPAKSATEERQVASFDAKPAKSATEERQVASFAEPQHFRGFQAPNTPKSATPSECWGEGSFSAPKMGQFASQPGGITPISFLPADIPEGWVDGLARLRPNCPPDDVPTQRWQQFIADARRLLRNGTLAQAAALGWDEIDLFGCADTKPLARIDQMGLVWLITGWRVVSISASAAIIEAPTGSRQTYRRKEHGVGQVPAWELNNQGGLH